MATNVNSEITRSRVEASSVGKHRYEAKEDESGTGHIWAAGFHHLRACSHLAHVLKLKNHLFLYFSIFFGLQLTTDN